MIKVIFFDIGGVYAKGNLYSVVENIAENLSISKREVMIAVKEYVWDFAVDKITVKEFCKNVAGKLNTTPERIKKLWAPEAIFQINRDVENIVLVLKKNGYVVGAITDIDRIHLKIHSERGTYNIFDIIINSVDTKLTKSDKEIYIKAVKSVKAKPEECVMIDDVEEKLAAAKELGMKTILFKDAEQLSKKLHTLGVKF